MQTGNGKILFPTNAQHELWLEIILVSYLTNYKYLLTASLQILSPRSRSRPVYYIYIPLYLSDSKNFKRYVDRIGGIVKAQDAVKKNILNLSIHLLSAYLRP